MTLFDQTVQEYGALLRPWRYRLNPTSYPDTGSPIEVRFEKAVFGTPLFVLPDVHLGDGHHGDIFLADSGGEKAVRLTAVLEALQRLMSFHPMAFRIVQMGDWFDFWRAEGGDVTRAQFESIQRCPDYQRILEIDANLGLPHVIGNHDASFLRSVPDKRASQPDRFRFGFWVGSSVYALHGHQTDVVLPPNSQWDQAAIAIASVAANVIPGVTTLEAYMDRHGELVGVRSLVMDLFGEVKKDPGPQPQVQDDRQLPDGLISGSCVRDDARTDRLAVLLDKVSQLSTSNGRHADVILVGHSHTPGISWVHHNNRVVVVVDSGAWVYRQANLLIAAGDTAAIFDVVAE